MHTVPWIDLVILAFASFRLTHLIVYDEVMHFLRRPFFTVEPVTDESGNTQHRIVPLGKGLRNFMGRLLSCHWCVGLWSTVLIVLLYTLVPCAFYVLLVLAIAGIAAMIESRAV